MPFSTVVAMWVPKATVEVDSQIKRHISWCKIDSQ